jgi:hypothetical protein
MELSFSDCLPRYPAQGGGGGGGGGEPPKKKPKKPKDKPRKLEEHETTEYGRFNIKARSGDPWEGHEAIMNSWLKRLGIIKGHGRGLSRFNSAIALSVEQHKQVSALQRAAGLYDEAQLAKMGLREMLTKNAQILIEAGVPESKVEALIDDALEMLPGLVGKGVKL